MNVAPTVSAGGGATITAGATLGRTGSFADPGADAWIASVDYGDGSGTHSLALNPDKTFALGHTYASPGSFAVSIWVADKDGAVGLGSFSVYVVPMPVTVTSVSVATIKIGAGKRAKKTTGLVIQFSGHSTQLSAKPSAYHLLLGTVKKGRTTYNKNVPLSSAIYSAAANTLTLIPKTKLNLAKPQQLRITASLLADSFGRPMDGDGDGQPGGDFTANLKGKAVTILAHRKPGRRRVSRPIRSVFGCRTRIPPTVARRSSPPSSTFCWSGKNGSGCGTSRWLEGSQEPIIGRHELANRPLSDRDVKAIIDRPRCGLGMQYRVLS